MIDAPSAAIRVGIIGSASDQGFNDENVSIAEGIGAAVAKRGWVLLYGPERQMSSLPHLAANACRRAGGTTIGVAHGSARAPVHDPHAASILIYTDTGGGGGREVVLINSCDFVIVVGGGSGTLAEMSLAYMNYIPIVAMKRSGGWADKLAGQYLDARRKYVIAEADDPEAALTLGYELYSQLKDRPSQASAPVFNQS